MAKVLHSIHPKLAPYEHTVTVAFLSIMHMASNSVALSCCCPVDPCRFPGEASLKTDSRHCTQAPSMLHKTGRNWRMSTASCTQSKSRRHSSAGASTTQILTSAHFCHQECRSLTLSSSMTWGPMCHPPCRCVPKGSQGSHGACAQMMRSAMHSYHGCLSHQ